MRYKRGTRANMLIQILCLCGEYPSESTNLFYGSPNVFRKEITKLKKDKLIDKVTLQKYNSKFKFARANPMLETYLKKMGYYDYYRTVISERVGISKEQSKRNQKQGQIMAMCLNNGIEVLPLYKEDFKDGCKGYYTLKELRKKYTKNIDTDIDSDMIMRYSTAFGVIMSEGENYVNYNCTDKLSYWNSNSELNTKNYILSLIKQTNPVYNENTLSSLITFKSFDDVWIMMDKEAQLEYEVSLSPHAKTAKHIRIDDTYSSVYAIPSSIDGTRIINILTTKDHKKKILSGLVNPEYHIDKTNNRLGLDCDAVIKIDDRDIYTLDLIDCNISRLNTFCNVAKLKNNKSSFAILCLDCYKDFLLERFGDYVGVRSYSFEDIEKILEGGDNNEEV